MFIGVLHDNSDMARVEKLAGSLLGMDIKTAISTGIVQIERFMYTEGVQPRFPMYLTCFYAQSVDEIESMALIMATEFSGNMKEEFTRAMAKREITTRAAKISTQENGTLKTYFTQFTDPEDIYWNFLAFLSLSSDSIADVTIDTVELADETCALVHYSDTIIGHAYVRGFHEGMQQHKAELLAADPAFSNVAVLAPKK